MLYIIYLNISIFLFDRLRLQRREFLLMLVCSANYTLINLYLKDLTLTNILSPGFWGGLVPGNAFNATALEGLLNAGVLGLKVNF